MGGIAFALCIHVLLSEQFHVTQERTMCLVDIANRRRSLMHSYINAGIVFLVRPI